MAAQQHSDKYRTPCVEFFWWTVSTAWRLASRFWRVEVLVVVSIMAWTMLAAVFR